MRGNLVALEVSVYDGLIDEAVRAKNFDLAIRMAIVGGSNKKAFEVAVEAVGKEQAAGKIAEVISRMW